MSATSHFLRSGFLSEKAQGMVEYALIAAFICAIAAFVFASPGRMPDQINELFGIVLTQVQALAGN